MQRPQFGLLHFFTSHVSFELNFAYIYIYSKSKVLQNAQFFYFVWLTGFMININFQSLLQHMVALKVKWRAVVKRHDVT